MCGAVPPLALVDGGALSVNQNEGAGRWSCCDVLFLLHVKHEEIERDGRGAIVVWRYVAEISCGNYLDLTHKLNTPRLNFEKYSQINSPLNFEKMRIEKYDFF
jgi:hypothetical protein